jgi:hypothetical protein
VFLDDDEEDAVEATLRSGIAQVHNGGCIRMVLSGFDSSSRRVLSVDPRGDPEYNLEKFLISWVSDIGLCSILPLLTRYPIQQLRRKGKIDEAGQVWDAVAKERSQSHRMWLAYTDFEM